MCVCVGLGQFVSCRAERQIVLAKSREDKTHTHIHTDTHWFGGHCLNLRTMSCITCSPIGRRCRTELKLNIRSVSNCFHSSLLSFVVTNSDSSRSSTLHFTIEHGDRIPPTLSRNVGLRLQDGSTVTITSDQLQLTDPDTTTANLGYVITQLPQHGKLLLRGMPLPSPPRFSQTNVDDLHLTYQHDPSSPAKIDGFYFMPSDGHNRGYLEFGQLREEPAVFDIQVSHERKTQLRGSNRK